jgi:mono/diheme cytochrome c family protein
VRWMTNLRKVSLLISASALLLVVLASASVCNADARSGSKSRGAQLFSTVGCVHCHGVAGISGGRGPSLASVRKRKTPDQIYAQIHDGGKSMPPFGDQLSSDQIEDLVKYLQSKRKPPMQTR